MSARRQPRGIPIGGQYAAVVRPTPPVDLTQAAGLRPLDGNPLLDALRAWSAEAPPANRHELSERYAWAIPDDPTLAAVAAACPNGAIEIGAGTGYWARLLHDRHQVDVEAFDSSVGGQGWWPVQLGGPDMAGRYPERTLLLSWPPYDDPMGFDTVEAYTAAGGQRVVFMGEPSTAGTGDVPLYALLGISDGCDPDEGICVCDVTPRWRPVDERAMPNWPWIHGRMWILEPQQPRRPANRPGSVSCCGPGRAGRAPQRE